MPAGATSVLGKVAGAVVHNSKSTPAPGTHVVDAVLEALIQEYPILDVWPEPRLQDHPILDVLPEPRLQDYPILDVFPEPKLQDYPILDVMPKPRLQDYPILDVLPEPKLRKDSVRSVLSSEPGLQTDSTLGAMPGQGLQADRGAPKPEHPNLPLQAAHRCNLQPLHAYCLHSAFASPAQSLVQCALTSGLVCEWHDTILFVAVTG